MSQTRHVVIGCLVALVLAVVVVLAAAGIMFYLGFNKFADTTENEGLEFGRRTDQQGCTDEALNRLRASTRAGNPITAQASSLFIIGCFQSCRTTPGFCNYAPKEDAFLPVHRWAQQRCEKEGAGNNSACINIFIQVSNACFGRIERRE